MGKRKVIFWEKIIENANNCYNVIRPLQHNLRRNAHILTRKFNFFFHCVIFTTDFLKKI